MEGQPNVKNLAIITAEAILIRFNGQPGFPFCDVLQAGLPFIKKGLGNGARR
jgi:hypothetical protein